MHPRNAYSTDQEFMKALRDDFAAKAIEAGIDKSFLITAMSSDECELITTNAAVRAYKIADAMIAERARS